MSTETAGAPRYPRDVTRAGIKDVATLAGVSLGTVSNYINHPQRVSAEKSERIQRAIDQLGYVRDSAAFQLRSGRSGAIAYLAPDVSNPFFATIAEGVEESASALGLSVLIANANRSRAREDAYLEQFRSQRVQGVLVASHEPIEERLTALRARGIPSVLVGQAGRSAEQPSVSVDEVEGGRLAVEHLLATGRRRIAYIGGPLNVHQVAERLEGAAAAVAAVPDASLEVVNIADRTIQGGRAAGLQLAARPAASRPDGVFAVNDLTALGILQALHESGVRVPEEVGLIGYDAIEFGEASLVPLSTIRTPQRGFGAAAVEMLFAAMNGDPIAEPRLVYAPELVARRSTGADPA